MFFQGTKRRFNKYIAFTLLVFIGAMLILMPIQSVLAEGTANAGIDTSALQAQLYSGDPNATVDPVQPTATSSDSTSSLDSANWEGINTSQMQQDINNPSAPTPSQDLSSVLTTVQNQQQENDKQFSGDVTKDTSSNIVERLFGTFISAIPSAMLNMLGLRDINQLVYDYSGFTSDDNSTTSTNPTMVWNTFSKQDYSNIIAPMNNGLTSVAWLIALALLYLTLIKLARAGANSQRRSSAFAMIEDWFLGAIFIAGGMILISVLFQILHITLTALQPHKITNFLGSKESTTGNFIEDMVIAPLYILALAGIEVALNFIYLQRYFVLLVLIGSAPLFNALYFHEKTRSAFTYYWKELIGNIFMPFFHAFFLFIYSLVSTNTGSTNIGMIPQLMFLIMMIPISNMLRSILGLAGTGKGLGENLLMGLGLGATMGMMRSFSNLGAVLSGGGSEAGQAMMTNSMMGGMGSNIGLRGESSSGSALGQITGGEYMNQMSNRVSRMRRIGGALGQAYGAVGGAVFGAATGGGNMTMMMSAMAGNRVGASAGSSMGGAAAVAPIAAKSATLLSPEKREQLGNAMTRFSGGRIDGAAWADRPLGSDAYNEALGGSSPLSTGLSRESRIELGKANASSLVAQGLRGTPFVGQAMENRANNAVTNAASSVMNEVGSNSNVPWESGDIMEKVSTANGAAIYQRKFDGIDADGKPQYGPRNLVDFGQQGHVAGSDSMPMVEQAPFKGDQSQVFKPNNVYTNMGKSDPRGPRGSAILNDLARKR